MTTAVPITLDRLRDGVREHWALSWAVTLVIGLLAFAVRLVGVDQPDRIMFDETYYAKDAWSLLQHGFEGELTDHFHRSPTSGWRADGLPWEQM